MNYKDTFAAKYDRISWLKLLHDVFQSKAKFDIEPYKKINVSSQLAKEALYLGKIMLSPSEELAVYEVELANNVDILRNRRGIRDMLTSDWRNQGFVGAFVLSFRKNESILRFSYISEIWGFNDKNEFVKTSTDTKRFTYLLGEGYSCRTAVEQFQKLSKSNQTLADVTAAFNVEALSKEFFSRYKDHYTHFVDYMVHTPSLREEFIDKDFNRTGLNAKQIKDREEKPIRDYVKKLLGRIVFLHFLQKKGWLGVPADGEWGDGKRDFMFKLFNEASKEQKQNFLDEVLKPLFSDGLDTDREADNHLFDTKVSGIGTVRIPYLNGGLFERDEMDEKPCSFPPQLFEDLLDTFSQYNFTIDENDPNDAEVGVDPEMLGRIFENLLEDNKDKGAYYTPKEIVQYMCRESLIAYLQTDENAEVLDGIRQFVTKHDANELSSSLQETIGEKLRNVKICDPAIGSGAFPMGLLRELFFCRCALDQHLQEKAADIKRDIIQSNIYGVDIERGAVDIARLRFWLSLVVDEKDPTTLPNLDFKIMQGNSLLESYKGVDLSDLLKQKKEEVDVSNRQLLLIEDELDILRKGLNEKINLYYSCGEHQQRQQLRHDIEELVRKQLHVKGYGNVLGDVPIYENGEFFLWHTWFNDVFSREGKEGFDIVIGNPPYIQLKWLKEKAIYKKKKFETYDSDGDIYCLFYEQAIKIMAPNSASIGAFITSNKWLRSLYGNNLRNFLLTKANPKMLIDLGPDVFDAGVDTNILFWDNSESTKTILYANAYDLNLSNVNFSHQLLWKDSIWTILSDEEISLKKKMDLITTYLPDFNVKLNYGILTGANPVFILDKKRAEKLISLDENNKKLIKPMLTGEDIHRYSATFNDWYILNLHNGVREKNIPPVSLYGYPSIMNYLNSFGEKFKKRGEQGKDWWNLRSCNYIFDYDRPKILYSDIVQERGKFYYDEEGYYANDTAFMIVGDNMKFLLGILNSTLFSFLYKKFYAGGGLGEKGLRYKKTFLLNVPIPKADADFQRHIEQKVDAVISMKKESPLADTSIIEKEIDSIVYQLYGLDKNDIEIVSH